METSLTGVVTVKFVGPVGAASVPEVGGAGGGGGNEPVGTGDGGLMGVVDPFTDRASGWMGAARR
jgi:hypothetical protein